MYFLLLFLVSILVEKGVNKLSGFFQYDFGTCLTSRCGVASPLIGQDRVKLMKVAIHYWKKEIGWEFRETTRDQTSVSGQDA